VISYLLPGCTLTFIMPAGSLPASWANLSSAVPTALVLAKNQLTGGIPDAYGSRISLVSNMASWAELDLSDNMHMCGPVESWFYSNVTKGVPSAAVASLQGNSIGKISKLHIFRCLSKICLERQCTVVGIVPCFCYR